MDSKTCSNLDLGNFIVLFKIVRSDMFSQCLNHLITYSRRYMIILQIFCPTENVLGHSLCGPI